MSKVKTILDADLVKKYVENNRRTISSELNKKSQTVIKDIVNHFKMDRWPLDFDFIRANLFMAVFGVDDMAFVAEQLSKHGINVAIGIKEGRTMLLLPKEKKPKKKAKKKNVRK